MKMQTILAFDTATNHCSVALWQDGKILAYLEDPTPGKQAERLVPIIEQAFKIARLDYKNLSAVATTTGPGSFTGIRICLATARAIALAANVPCIGLTTLEVLAEAAGTQHAAPLILATLNAGKGDVYAQLFASGSAISDAQMIKPEQINVLIQNQTTHIAGNVRALIEPFINANTVTFCDDCLIPSAQYVAKLAARRTPSDTPPAAFYIRPPDAAPHQPGKIK